MRFRFQRRTWDFNYNHPAGTIDLLNGENCWYRIGVSAFLNRILDGSILMIPKGWGKQSDD